MPSRSRGLAKQKHQAAVCQASSDKERFCRSACVCKQSACNLFEPVRLLAINWAIIRLLERVRNLFMFIHCLPGICQERLINNERRKVSKSSPHAAASRLRRVDGHHANLRIDSRNGLKRLLSAVYISRSIARPLFGWYSELANRAPLNMASCSASKPRSMTERSTRSDGTLACHYITPNNMAND